MRELLRKLFDAAWEWTYDHERDAQRRATVGIPPCDGRCCWDFTNGHLYSKPHPYCAALEASRSFRFWRNAHACTHNMSIKLGVN